MYHRQIACRLFDSHRTRRARYWRALSATEPRPSHRPIRLASSLPVHSVHSGPGENFYPTDTLAQGDTVEVYREKPGGWLAIRPPVGSYSWVAERDLILKDGGLAEVVKDDVASRIGSRLSDRHNAAQVRLKKGEGVEVLGEENISGEKWYKIAPPAGEFRWIQASVVERDRADTRARSPRPATDTSRRGCRTAIQQTSGTSAATAPISTATSNSDAPPLASYHKTLRPEHTTDAKRASNRRHYTTRCTSHAAAPATSQPQRAQASGDLSHELAAVELRLSRMAAAPTNLWNTERLERDTAQLLARAKTPAERDAVRVTQEKINRFAEIGRRANPASSNVAQSRHARCHASASPRATSTAHNASRQPPPAVRTTPSASCGPSSPAGQALPNSRSSTNAARSSRSSPPRPT